MTPAQRLEPLAAPDRSRRLWYLGSAGLLGLLLAVGSDRAAPPPADTPTSPRPTGVAAPAAAANPMDEPLRLLAKAKESFAGVRDYSCTLVKRERLEGQMSPDNVIAMKVRNQPFSVYLRWLEPRSLVGQEACYVAGKNEGNMRVKSPGLLGAVGFVTLAPNDERARKSSRHAITEAGIANLLQRYGDGWETERKWNQTQVRVGEYEYNKRRCVRVEAIHPANPDGRFTHSKNVLYFDKETNLPVRTECYDWPRRAGEAGELAEVYSYVNLKLNVGLGDDVFDH
jgi:hypothetical protein